MAIYRGDGGSGDSSGDASNFAAIAVQKATDAANSATAAATSAAAAASSASAASLSQTSAANSASNAATSASAASNSASNAATSASTASTQASNAATSASSASTSASNAATSAGNAATSATNSSNSATLAQDWAVKTTGFVNGSEYSAKYHAQQAATSASSASFSAGAASTSATQAANSATSAANSATAAATSAFSVFQSTNTANSISYLNGSNVLVATSALKFDGVNLGIGLTPSAWRSVYRAAQFGSAGVLTGRTDSNDVTFGSNWYEDSSSIIRYVGAGNATRYTQTAGSHQWQSAASGAAGGTVTFSTLMQLNSSGNLGLGVAPSTWSNGGNIQIPNDRTLAWSGTLGEIASNAYFNTTWKYTTAGVAAMYTQDAGVHKWFNAATGALDGNITWIQAMTLDTSSNLTVAANVTAYSDERLKANWSDLNSDFIEKLAEVKHGTYDRVDNNTRQAGVSAQSLQQVLPETVIHNTDGYLSVAYGNAALVACIQLANRVLELEKEIKKLKGQ